MDNDPYSRDAPGVADPANNLIAITLDDDTDIPVGIKALRIYNPAETESAIKVTTVAGEDVTFSIPPMCVCIEPLRVARVWETGTTATLEVHGYTDFATPA